MVLVLASVQRIPLSRWLLGGHCHAVATLQRSEGGVF